MTTASTVYQKVMEDVIDGVREYFLEFGLEEKDLQQLKQLWETKLQAQKSTSNQNPAKDDFWSSVGTSSMVGNKKVLTRTVFSTQPPKPNSKQRVLTIQVPPSILQNNQLQKILTNPIINSTVGLPISIANNILQQHVNAALGIKPQPIEQVVILNSVIQGDAALIEDNEVDTNIPESTQQSDNIVKSNRKKSKIELKQYDGGNDQDEDKQKMENTADPKDDEEKSLNSDDDIDEDDDFSDTNNVIICQYEKINKIRNKWTMHLKEGIMNLNGKEYVFHKAKGDTKW